VEKAALGEFESAAGVARDLTAGPQGEVEGAAEEAGSGKVGAALGFVGFAEDPEELADAITSAASGCGLCHAATGALPPERPVWSHLSGAAWVVDGLVWSRTEAPPMGGEPPLDALAETWARPAESDVEVASEGEVRAARVVAACARCHLEL
jgi:cytochrome c553